MADIKPLIDAGATAIAGKITHMSLHTADPSTTGANESTAARQAVTPSASAETVSIGSTSFTGGTASGACTYAGFWDAATSGNFLGSVALTGDQAFNAAGEYTVTSTTITGS